MKSLANLLQDLLSLFFPELCAGCGASLFSNEREICTSCIYHLPVTNFHKDPSNELAKQLWGRFNFKQASSFVFFRKGGRVQNIIHQLKYNKRPKAGFRMGELYAIALNNSETWQKPDLIIPVPLHPSRLRQRGYNQSERIAEGLASVLQVPVAPGSLVRTENTQTQTKRSRFGRYENLRDAFSCPDKKPLVNKHVLIVDDVMTTGATLESCCLALAGIDGLSISIITLAFTE
ncbi:ComF family protein [Daejeonella sp. JGW-45]|uniref:ComF family protein n=1 Tax=Daejeonella sp. JGW-45 TaxID=3034148 RepID=UPI0023EA8B66|nr:ComF family protein [Daejeonella sp. JGW-45]